MQKKEYSVDIGGKTFTIKFTDLADQANGSVMVQYGNTLVHATAVMSEYPKEGLDYFPLTVDYEERFYAAGQILGSRFIRREGRPSDEAVLSGRVVDRTIRPLFDSYIRNEVQVVVMILSLGEYDPDILAVNAASLALATSDIPWNGPVSAVRIGLCKDGDTFLINPTYTERESTSCIFDLTVCGKDGNITMIEVGAREVPEDTVLEGLKAAQKEIEKFQEFQEMVIAEIGREKQNFPKPEVPKALIELYREQFAGKIDGAVFSGPGKAGIKALRKEWLTAIKTALPELPRSIVEDYYDEQVNALLHQEAIERQRRPDGRALTEVRPLYAQAGGLSPLLHGTGIFYRGGTHILSALTLGGPQEALVIDGMEMQTKKHFMHHYNFPPFAPGETGRVGGFNRRQIGHGALAEKALLPVIPPKEQFPYTTRIVSETMASNGSTSMGSVCASTLALMDAGVPIKTPVAGIASGVMIDKNNPARFALLTDIQGPEDEHGDMDFKVAGTKDGVTAIQMDVKVDGVSIGLLSGALEAARVARMQILEVITKEISVPRPELSPYAPRIVITGVKPSQIGMVIGTGGKVVNEIRELTGTEIEIEEDGTIYITGKGDGPERAKKIIEDMTHEFTPGERLTGTITKIVDFGAFVRIGPNTEGLVHVSEIAPFRVNNVNALLKEGMEVPVLVKEVSGPNRVSLSIKEANPRLFTQENAHVKKNTQH